MESDWSLSQGVDEAAVLEKPIIYVHFAEGIGENKYLPVSTWDALHKLLLEALAQYNDMVASLNLVLFEDAMDHICRWAGHRPPARMYPEQISRRGNSLA